LPSRESALTVLPMAPHVSQLDSIEEAASSFRCSQMAVSWLWFPEMCFDAPYLALAGASFAPLLGVPHVTHQIRSSFEDVCAGSSWRIVAVLVCLARETEDERKRPQGLLVCASSCARSRRELIEIVSGKVARATGHLACCATCYGVSCTCIACDGYEDGRSEVGLRILPRRPSIWPPRFRARGVDITSIIAPKSSQWQTELCTRC